MLPENIETIPREMSLVDLVFKTFRNWGKSEIPHRSCCQANYGYAMRFLFRSLRYLTNYSIAGSAKYICC
jgi:hypothetical protein